MSSDPRALPEFVVALHGAPGVGRSSLRRAVLDLPAVTEADLARLDVVDVADALQDGGAAPASPGVCLLVTRSAPGAAAGEVMAALGSGEILVAVHARDLDPDGDDAVREAWAAVVGPDRVHLTATPEDGVARGIDGLRAALFAIALAGVDVTVSEARRAKRPYAAGIIAGAAVATAAEALLPGAAALVVTSQIGAIGSLSYLYTGRFMGRGQALALLPMFASEAAGGSLFLLAKSFFPPTGVADAAAAAVASSLTVAMLGAVAWTLERGYSLDQKDKLREAFRRLRARSVADRAELLKGRARWREKSFWADVVQRWIFEG